jgi:hypothetical protein
MSSYAHKLKLPNKGHRWDVGFVLVCLAWVVLLPLAALLLHCALASRRYSPDNRMPSLPVVSGKSTKRQVITVKVVSSPPVVLLVITIVYLVAGCVPNRAYGLLWLPSDVTVKSHRRRVPNGCDSKPQLHRLDGIRSHCTAAKERSGQGS